MTIFYWLCLLKLFAISTNNTHATAVIVQGFTSTELYIFLTLIIIQTDVPNKNKISFVSLEGSLWNNC